ncbi:Rrf2 family protein [Friedmanniella luteola]|uniref:Rrf2 family protein n=1 Tax=Friedmanniella luteola TaxID=546871 RepID=A0A1H1WGD4_9ACTN|nr:Rrf2 family transcriptional regulator [Friedmanniella luteola]SDS96092.1 Rrf2 family protein [Friedmanniella luteola]
MRVPAATNYAVRALLELATAPGDPLPLHVIAERQQISHRFLEHIFRDLRAAGLVSSHRGGHGRGGYLLTVPVDRLTLASVVAALQPATGALAELTGPGRETSGHPGLDAVWLDLQRQIVDFLDDITIADLAGRAGATPPRPAPLEEHLTPGAG